MGRIGNWWHQLMESTVPRDPDQYFGNKGEGGRVTTDELSEIVDGEERDGYEQEGYLDNLAPGDMVECRVGERVRMRTGFSEVLTHIHADGMLLEAEILPGAVQLYDGDKRRYSSPITYAEAGVMELNGRLYYKNT